MFIKTRYSGYNRNDEQTAAGYFLMLLQPRTDSTKYPGHDVNCACGKMREQHDEEQKTRFPDCTTHGVVARIRKLTDLKGTPEYEAARDEMDEALKAGNGDRHVAGCPECDAYKAYYSECRNFTYKNLDYPFRALVRYTRLVQFGHFMMGTVRVGNHKLTLSGSYGSDGLPMSVSDEVYEAGVELPADLRKQWSEGGGWNSCGSEAPALRAWAIKTFARSKKGTLR